MRRCRMRRLESCMGEEEGRSGNVFVVIRIPDGWLLQSRVFIFPGSYVGRFVIPWRSLVFHIALHPGLHISSVHPQFPNRFIYKLYPCLLFLFLSSSFSQLDTGFFSTVRSPYLYLFDRRISVCVRWWIDINMYIIILSFVVSKWEHLLWLTGPAYTEGSFRWKKCCTFSVKRIYIF